MGIYRQIARTSKQVSVPMFLLPLDKFISTAFENPLNLISDIQDIDRSVALKRHVGVTPLPWTVNGLRYEWSH